MTRHGGEKVVTKVWSAMDAILLQLMVKSYPKPNGATAASDEPTHPDKYRLMESLTINDNQSPDEPIPDQRL